MGQELNVYVTIKNIGKRTGEEVVQLYICDKFASVVRPVKELKGFEKVKLNPSEEIKVTFNTDGIYFNLIIDVFYKRYNYFSIYILMKKQYNRSNDK